MKKLSILAAMVFFFLGAQAQDLKCTVGGNAPGKLANGRAYEDFISGQIRVVDGAGTAYQFVSAEFSLTSRQGKNLGFTMKQAAFAEAQWKQIIDTDDEGTTYTFSNITVKDAAGKEYVLPKLTFEFPVVKG